MSTANSTAAWRPLGKPELALLGFCVLLCFVAAWIGLISGIALVAIVVLPVAAMASSLVFGITGSLLVASAIVVFLLMNRIDEGLVLNFGMVSLKSSYWLVMLAAIALAGVNLLRLSLGARSDLRTRGTTRSFMVLFFAFVVVLIAGATYNQFNDDSVVLRDVPGEVLASLSILAPMLFVPLILNAPFQRYQLVLTVAAIVALGGLAGLIMASFGFLPSNLINALGWADANHGTATLLRGRLPLGHPNFVAAVLILLLPFATVMGLMPGGRHFRAIYLGCAVLMFAGVLFSLARSALLVTTAIVGLTTLYIYFGRGRKTFTTYMLPVFFVVGLIGVMTYLFLTFDFSRFWSRGYIEAASVERRQNSMLTSLYIFADHPVFGITPDAFYNRLELRPGWDPPMQDNVSPIFYYKSHMTAETPHNMFLTILAESGILGAICFLGTIIFVFRALWRLRRHPGLSDEQRHAIMGFMLGMVGFLMMGMFEALLFVGMRPAFLFWAIAGLALRYAHDVVAQAESTAMPTAALPAAAE